MSSSQVYAPSKRSAFSISINIISSLLIHSPGDSSAERNPAYKPSSQPSSSTSMSYIPPGLSIASTRHGNTHTRDSLSPLNAIIPATGLATPYPSLRHSNQTSSPPSSVVASSSPLTRPPSSVVISPARRVRRLCRGRYQCASISIW